MYDASNSMLSFSLFFHEPTWDPLECHLKVVGLSLEALGVALEAIGLTDSNPLKINRK